MNFAKAFEEAKKGRAIRFSSWPKENIALVHYEREKNAESENNVVAYLYIDDGINSIKWDAKKDELFSDQWEVVE